MKSATMTMTAAVVINNGTWNRVKYKVGAARNVLDQSYVLNKKINLFLFDIFYHYFLSLIINFVINFY